MRVEHFGVQKTSHTVLRQGNHTLPLPFPCRFTTHGPFQWQCMENSCVFIKTLKPDEMTIRTKRTCSLEGSSCKTRPSNKSLSRNSIAANFRNHSVLRSLLILSSHLHLGQPRTFCLQFNHQHPVFNFRVPHACYLPCPLHSFTLHHSNTIW